MPELSYRARKILYSVITEYIATGEPVGSRRLAKRYGLNLSPASIRNVLADLEEAGFLTQPHLSAGRVPTDTGFRVFVDALVQMREVGAEDRAAVVARMQGLSPGADVAREAGRLLSSLAGTVSLVAPPRTISEALTQLRFVPLGDKRVLAVLVSRGEKVQNRIVTLEEEVDPRELEHVHNYLNDIVSGRTLSEVRQTLAEQMETARTEYIRLSRSMVEAALEGETDEPAEVMIEGQGLLFGRPEFQSADKNPRFPPDVRGEGAAADAPRPDDPGRRHPSPHRRRDEPRRHRGREHRLGDVPAARWKRWDRRHPRPDADGLCQGGPARGVHRSDRREAARGAQRGGAGCGGRGGRRRRRGLAPRGRRRYFPARQQDHYDSVGGMVSGEDGNGVERPAGVDGDEPLDGDAATEAEAASDRDPMTALAIERDKLKDQLLRTAADFDNFRKRTRRDLEEAERRGKEEVVQEILPVIDNLERAVAAATTAADAVSVAEGVRMVLKQFEDTAGRIGLERVRALGERFDPALHDAVQQKETADETPGTIVGEIVPGYRLGGKLVRAALVVVARPPAGDETGSNGDEA